MIDNKEKLIHLDNDKLIDIVKNYRQYGYDDQLRETVILILEDRGITKEQLKITGSFENRTYDDAQNLFHTFKKNSIITFIIYMILFLSRVAIRLLPDTSINLTTLIFILTILAFILYFVFLIMSFINQIRFYKAIGEDYGTEGALIYLFLGMPFYFFMYFYFRNQMKDKMKEIK